MPVFYSILFFLLWAASACAQTLSPVSKYVNERELFGYENKKGKLIISYRYSYASDFKNNYAVVGKHNTSIGSFYYGIIDTNGRELIPITYQDVDFFSSGLAVAKKDGKYGYINKSNKTVIAFTYSYASPFAGSYAIVAKDGLYGVIDKANKIRIPIMYQNIKLLQGKINTYTLFVCSNSENEQLIYIDQNKAQSINITDWGEYNWEHRQAINAWDLCDTCE